MRILQTPDAISHIEDGARYYAVEATGPDALVAIFPEIPI